MANFLYVDNSNVWIEGKRLSAKIKSLNCDFDNDWIIDFGRLMEFAGGKDGDIAASYLFGSRPPKNDSLWSAAEKKGFTVKVEDRNIANKEKKIDTGIVTQIMEDFYENAIKVDVFTLVAGDGDYVPMITKIKSKGFIFDVVFWDSASQELKDIASNFISMDQYIDYFAKAPKESINQ